MSALGRYLHTDIHHKAYLSTSLVKVCTQLFELFCAKQGHNDENVVELTQLGRRGTAPVEVE